MEEKTTVELLKTIAFQSPGLVGIILVAWMFMKHLAKRQEYEKELHDDHIDERTQCRQAMQQNAHALRSFSDEIQKNLFMLDRNTKSNDNLAQIIQTKL